ncbi:MAG: PGF-CTERM sorting domain-containing protein [Methanothrix sp.]|nr:PGF-CTERM sorting domain-containing protein [Methanothrix sp.]
MKNYKILLCMTALICFAFQAFAQSDPLGASSSDSTMGSSGDYLNPNMGQMSRDTSPDDGVKDMVQWLDQPVNNDVTKSTAIATGTTPSPDAAKSTATTETGSERSPDTTESTTTTTISTPASKPTSTTTATATSTTPGFGATFAVAGLLAVTFIVMRRRR